MQLTVTRPPEELVEQQGEQRRNARETRWSISVKLRDRGDHGSGCWSLFPPADSHRRWHFLAVFASSKACEHKMPPPFAPPRPDHVCARRKPKLTCRHFTPTVKHFRNVSRCSAAEHGGGGGHRLLPIRCGGGSADYQPRCRQLFPQNKFTTRGRTTVSRVACKPVPGRGSSGAGEMSGSPAHMLETKKIWKSSRNKRSELPGLLCCARSALNTTWTAQCDACTRQQNDMHERPAATHELATK